METRCNVTLASVGDQMKQDDGQEAQLALAEQRRITLDGLRRIDLNPELRGYLIERFDNWRIDL